MNLLQVIFVSTTIIAAVYASAISTTKEWDSQREEYDAKFLEIITKAERSWENLPKDIAEDAKLKVPEIIWKYGYPCEIHTIESKDGYILEMHRIPYGKKGPSQNRSAVVLQHGLLMSSADWILSGTEKGLAYILADAGYDVWMGNARGTRYSRKHKSYDPDKNAAKFWDFSWHEIGINDVSAFIDHAREQTAQDKVFYIGHSQGTTAFYVLMAEKPEYNDKIRVHFSLAPIAYMRWMTSPILRLGSIFEPFMSIIAKWVGIHEFLPHSRLLATVGDVLCGDDSIMQILCTNSLFAVCGFNKQQMNATLIPIMMGHTPAGSSTKQVLHYAQEINSGKFRQYDYGFFKNRRVYGKSRPPNYKLKNIKAPIYLHYSNNDWLSNPKDVDKLYRNLPNILGKFLSPDKKFNHVDYMYGIDAPELLYNRVLSLLDRHLSD